MADDFSCLLDNIYCWLCSNLAIEYNKVEKPYHNSIIFWQSGLSNFDTDGARTHINLYRQKHQ